MVDNSNTAAEGDGDNGADEVSDSNLGRATLSAGAYTIVSQFVMTCVRTIGLMVLARIIIPADFGLVAQVAAIVGLTNLIGDFGISVPIIQSRHLSQRQLSSLFWVTIGVGLTLAVVVGLAAPLIAWLYSDPRVVGVCLISALTVLVRSPSTQFTALLRRRLRFDRLAVVEISAAVFGVACAIALSRFGYWALVTQSLASGFVLSLGAWWACGWSPDFYCSLSEVRDKLKMGGNFTAGSILNYFARNGDNILIAKYWGPTEVGLYAKAYGLLVLPLQQIAGPMGRVAVPALSRLQGQPERYRQFFRKGCTIAFVLQVPVTIFAAFAGREIVLTLLGPTWLAAVPIFFALVPNLFVSTTSPATTWVFLSRGETDRWLILVAVNSLLILIGFAIGVQYGAIGVAWSFSIVTCLIRIPSILYCFKPTPLSLRDFFPLMIPSVVCSGIATAGGYLLIQWLPAVPAPALLLIKAVVFFVIYLIAIQRTESGRICYETVQPHLPAFAKRSLGMS